MKKLYESKEWLYNRYVVQRKNSVEIAKEAGCSHMTIQRYLEKFGLMKGRGK
jgi:DNA-binding MurR/RpiR family transcriptional regulator